MRRVAMFVGVFALLLSGCTLSVQPGEADEEVVSDTQTDQPTWAPESEETLGADSPPYQSPTETIPDDMPADPGLVVTGVEAVDYYVFRDDYGEFTVWLSLEIDDYAKVAEQLRLYVVNPPVPVQVLYGELGSLMKDNWSANIEAFTGEPLKDQMFFVVPGDQFDERLEVQRELYSA